MPHADAIADSAQLPHLAEVFEKLRRGRHLCAQDGAPYRALATHEDRFTALFASLGFELVCHRRGFYHFRSQQKPSDAATRMTLFVFVLVEWLSNRGQGIEEALLAETFTLDQLPHLQGERHARILAEAGLASVDDLDRVVVLLERYGFATRTAAGAFRFRAPVCRFLDLCLDVLDAARPDAEDADDPDGQPHGQPGDDPAHPDGPRP